MNDIGSMLKERRDDLGYELKDVSEILKIRSEYLAAVENWEMRRTPSKVYFKGYLKSYADYLGFDGDAIVEYFNIHDNDDSDSDINPRDPITEESKPTFLVILISLCITLSLYNYWLNKEHRTSESSYFSDNINFYKPSNHQVSNLVSLKPKFNDRSN